MTGNPPFYADHSNLLVYKDAQGNDHPVRTAADWEKRREHILWNMQLVMGPLPDSSRRVPLDMQILGETALPGCRRLKISFAVERDNRVPAYLLFPQDLGPKAPAMLCPHPSGPRGKESPADFSYDSPNVHFAIELAQRGYVTLSPDYPGFGEYKYDPYAHGYVSATMKGIWNHMRAVDLLQSLPEVDGDRIGTIGQSMGGYNSLFVAVFDTRVKVIISSCGFNSFPKYYGGDLTGWSHKGHMPRIAEVYDKDPRKMPFDFPEVVAALAPRPFFTNSPVDDINFEVSGVRDCIAAARRVYELLGAGDKLEAFYPKAGHDFPQETRTIAYAWLDRLLGQK
jgi:dienelactone hydrolase